MQEDAIDTLQAFIDRHGGSNREGYNALIEIAAKAIFWAAGIRQDCEPDQSICEICLACRDVTERAHGLRVGHADNPGFPNRNEPKPDTGVQHGMSIEKRAEDIPPAKDPVRSPWREW
jgi:hypothetical protein